MLGEVETAFPLSKTRTIGTRGGAAARSHGPQDRAREPCACFPDDARSARQQTPSNELEWSTLASACASLWLRLQKFWTSSVASNIIQALEWGCICRSFGSVQWNRTLFRHCSWVAVAEVLDYTAAESSVSMASARNFGSLVTSS